MNIACVMAAAAMATGILSGVAAEARAGDAFRFDMVRSNGLPGGCAANAKARVQIVSLGFAERMTVQISGLKPGTALAGFVIQVPNFPFGISWYLGDVEVGDNGRVTKSFVSRLNDETFAVAVGSAPAPTVDAADADTNPEFAPVHTFHLGFWFDSPDDAAANGCPAITTPFNDVHEAGIQVLSTRNFGDKNGPLRRVD